MPARPSETLAQNIADEVHATRATIARNRAPRALAGAALAAQQAKARRAAPGAFASACLVVGTACGMAPGAAVFVGVFDTVGLYGTLALLGSSVCSLACAVVAKRVGL